MGFSPLWIFAKNLVKAAKVPAVPAVLQIFYILNILFTILGYSYTYTEVVLQLVKFENVLKSV